MEYMMGIDLGTSSVKALLLDKNGNVAETAKREYGMLISEKGYAEQDPAVWFEATIEVIREVLEKSGVAAANVEVLGLSGQMHGLVLLDERGQVLRPAIIWPDQRTAPQVRFINNRVGKGKLGEYTSNPMATGFFAVSLMWIRENQPDIYRRTKVALFPKDYIRFYLTGHTGSEITDASGSGIFDVSMARWSHSLIEQLEIRKDFLPEIAKPSDISGELLPAVARETGLLEGTRVVFGGSDQSMQALGNGITRPGQLAINIGTGGQVYTPIQLPTYDKQLRMHKFCSALPGTWNMIGATLAAGLSLKWLAQDIFQMDNYDAIEELSAHSQPGSNGVVFLPYLSGERTPHMDSEATGMFFGLKLRNRNSDLVRAVMEGVVFSFKDCFEILHSMGIKAERIIAAGGGGRRRLWRQMIADVFECKVHVSKTEEEAAFGAAMVAGIGAGIFPTFEEACRVCVKMSEEVIHPIEENFKVYKKNFEIYKELYLKTREINSL